MMLVFGMGKIEEPTDIQKKPFTENHEMKVLKEPIFVSNDEWDFQITAFGLLRRPKNSEHPFERVEDIPVEEFGSLPLEVKEFLTNPAF